MRQTWEKFVEKISHRLFDEEIFEDHQAYFQARLDEADPTDHKEYTVWIAAKYANGAINKIEDFARVHAALTIFNRAKIKKQLKDLGFSADINACKSLTDLEDLVEKLPQEEGPSEREIKDSGSIKTQNEHWTTIVPLTHEASRLYGSHTRWCTTLESPSLFQSYSSKGPLHIMIPKNPNYEGEKYQFHLATGSFMNEKDAPAKLTSVLAKRPNPTVSNYLSENIFTAPESMQIAAIEAGDLKAIELIGKKSEKFAVHSAIFRAPVSKEMKAEAAQWMENNFHKASKDEQLRVAKSGPANLQDKLVNSTDRDVQAALIQYGTQGHRMSMYASPTFHEALIVPLIKAKYSTYEEMEYFLDLFVTHAAPNIRLEVAKTKSVKHLNLLSKDASFMVRGEVLKILAKMKK